MSSMMNTLIEVAITAGKIALSKREECLDISKKFHDDGFDIYDICTNADLEVESYIVNHLHMRHRTFEFISEETHAGKDIPQCCFIIDPIDGTINFANGFPLWGVQIACIMGGRVVAAVIHLPEVGRTYAADEDAAYLNGKKITVSDIGLDEGLYSIEGANRTIGRSEMIENGYYNLRDFYSSCVSFAMVAGGTSVASAYIHHCPWDYIPGAFIVKAAGGVSYDDFDKNIHIVANNAEVLDEMKRILYSSMEKEEAQGKCESGCSDIVVLEKASGQAQQKKTAKTRRKIKRGYARALRRLRK